MRIKAVRQVLFSSVRHLWTLCVVVGAVAPILVAAPLASAQSDGRRGSKQAPAPRVIKTVPTQGAVNVEPTLSEIRVTFDRDMAGGMSWTGGPPSIPDVDRGRKAQWIDARTCVLPVTLKDGRNYRAGINSPSFQNFRSKQGVPVRPTALYFNTIGAKVPKVASMTPANGATAVDPGLQAMLVQFDQPMRDSTSITGNGPRFPKSPDGKTPSWSTDRKTLTVPVSLEPGKDYEFGLNSLSFMNFQNEDGVPIEPIVVKFRTRAQ